MRNKTRIKICGIRSPDEIELANLYGADAVGFITEVPVKSPRKLDSDTAASLVSEVPKSMDSVLVIMPENVSKALALIEKVNPDIVQVHSTRPLSELEIIKEKMDIPIIKTLTIPALDEISGDRAGKTSILSELLKNICLLEDAGVVDSILLDTGKPGKPGGTGCVHDWSLSKRIAEKTKLPLILAGGLKPENVQEAIRTVTPYAVDTASGVETCGKKDALKIRNFIEEVRCANAFL